MNNNNTNDNHNHIFLGCDSIEINLVYLFIVVSIIVPRMLWEVSWAKLKQS